jgi:hypothetical protein
MRDYKVTYKSVPLMCDSSSAICLPQNSVFHERGKHIKVRHHFLRDHVEKGDIEMRYIKTERQLARSLLRSCATRHTTMAVPASFPFGSALAAHPSSRASMAKPHLAPTAPPKMPLFPPPSASRRYRAEATAGVRVVVLPFQAPQCRLPPATLVRPVPLHPDRLSTSITDAATPPRAVPP